MGIANSKKLLDKNITNWSDKDVTSWSDDQFMTLKETISQYIPLIRYYHIPKSYIDKQIKQYRLDPILSRVIMRRNDKAIWSDKYHGPCFGTLDLCMESNRWTSVYADYCCRITSLNRFTVEEYEVLAFENFNSIISEFIYGFGHCFRIMNTVGEFWILAIPLMFL
ncbi:19305_t:CDS:2, partial [Racocetra persica]